MLGLELGYDKSPADNFQHTDEFRERFYADVHDGWYQSTAASVRVGVRGELRITRGYFDRVLSAPGGRARCTLAA